ncbi:MAG: aminotransferase class I/II-fold pyridoxal phosphate-dependent enzyme [Acidobacteriota bacterium]
MSGLVDELGARLETLGARDRRRTLTPAAGIDFSSNDYLGLSRHPHLRRTLAERLAAGAGDGGPGPTAPASRLLRGHTSDHAAIEGRLAAWKGMERALLFPSGYQANLGLLGTVVAPGDRVLSDALNHASIIDALRFSRCEKVIYPHLDTAAVAEHLARPWPGGRTFLVTESLYSMDGDIAPLDVYADLCRRYGAELVVDDAHATGLFGRRGSGLVERFGVAADCLAVMSTCGKALGVGGAFVAGGALLVDYLVNASRAFVFSTAVPPMVAWGVDAALDLVAAEPWRRQRVRELAQRLRGVLTDLPKASVPAGDGPIVPVILGEERRALDAAASLAARGFDVRAVRPPTVAPRHLQTSPFGPRRP